MFVAETQENFLSDKRNLNKKNKEFLLNLKNG